MSFSMLVIETNQIPLFKSFYSIPTYYSGHGSYHGTRLQAATSEASWALASHPLPRSLRFSTHRQVTYPTIQPIQLTSTRRARYKSRVWSQIRSSISCRGWWTLPASRWALWRHMAYGTSKRCERRETCMHGVSIIQASKRPPRKRPEEQWQWTIPTIYPLPFAPVRRGWELRFAINFSHRDLGVDLRI